MFCFHVSGGYSLKQLFRKYFRAHKKQGPCAGAPPTHPCTRAYTKVCTTKIKRGKGKKKTRETNSSQSQLHSQHRACLGGDLAQTCQPGRCIQPPCSQNQWPRELPSLGRFTRISTKQAHTLQESSSDHAKLEPRLSLSISSVFCKNTAYNNVIVAMTQPIKSRSIFFTKEKRFSILQTMPLSRSIPGTNN